MDYDKYDYLPVVDYKNVFYQIDKTSAAQMANFTYVIEGPLRDFVDALIAHRPHWKFAGSRLYRLSYGGDTMRGVRSFTVYENNEELGTIDTSVAYRAGAPVRMYQYDNYRLRLKRERGSWNSSAKLEVAAKAVLKHFTTKSVAELVNDRMTKAAQTIGNAVNSAARDFRADFAAIEAALPNFVIENWDVVSAQLRGAGISVSDELPILYERMENAMRVHAAHSKQQGVTIYIRGTDYVVIRGVGDTKETNIIPAELLPTHYKRGLGLLKLAEVRQLIPDVGMRCAEDTYFVMETDND